MSRRAGGAAATYRPDIDGLRAIAITYVVLYHAGVRALGAGFVGVDVFFVISGYLIGGIILREARAGTFGFAAFYARRARRILPALLLVVAVTVALGCVLLPTEDLRHLGATAGESLVAVSNFKFWLRTNYFTLDARTDPLLMTWSLGVEEQFYLLTPAFLLVVMRWRRDAVRSALLALSAVSLGSWVYLTATAPEAAFYLLPPRAWELAAGALLAVSAAEHSGRPAPTWHAHAEGVAGIAMLLASATLFDDSAPASLFAVPLSVLGAVLVIRAPGSLVNRGVLSSAPFRLVGLVSYSWYLWHWPLMAYLRVVSGADPPRGALLGAAALAFGLAVGSWRLIERPFRRPTLTAPRVLWSYAVVVALALFVADVVRSTGGWSGRLPPAASHVEKTLAMGRGADCLLAFGRMDRPAVCRPGPVNAPAMALLGDSHAAALQTELRRLAAAHGVRLLSYTKSACPPLLGVTFRSVASTRHADECARFMRRSAAEIAADPAIGLVIVASYWALGWERGENHLQKVGVAGALATEEALDTGLPPMLAALRAAGKDVVLVGDVPSLRFDAPRHALSRIIPARRRLADLIDADPGVGSEFYGIDLAVAGRTAAANARVRAIGTRHGAAFLALMDRFCAGERCRYAAGDELLYFDHEHLTSYGAAYGLEPVRGAFAHGEPILRAASWASAGSPAPGRASTSRRDGP